MEEEQTPYSVLSKKDDQVVKELLPFLDEKNTKKIVLDEPKKHNITFFLIVFRDSYPTEFYLLLKQIQKAAELIGPQMIHSLIGPEIISFFDVIPNGFWRNLEVDATQLPTYFIFPQTYKQINSTIEIQKQLMQRYPYPNNFPNVPNGDIFSFCNSSFQKHFVDVSFQSFFDCIISGDYSSVEELCRFVPDLSAFFIASQRAIMYADLESCIMLFGMQHPKSIATEALDRFKGDYEIIQMLSFLANTDVCTGDIESSSIPFILSDVLTDQSIHQLKMPLSFLISDKDSKKDIDLITSFWVFKTFFECINKPSSAPQIEKYLSKIQDTNTREKVVVDLFSLLFLKTKENSYLCVPLFVESILAILTKYSDNGFISVGYLQFSSAQPRTLAELFNKDRSQVLFAMDEKDWEKAYAMGGLSKYRKMIDLAKEVDKVVETSTPSDNPQVMLESSLSTFSKWSELESKDPLVNQLIKQRSKLSSSLFDVLPETEKWTPSATFVELFETDGLEFIASGHANLYQNTIHGEKLCSFIQYCTLYYKCSSLSNFVEFTSFNASFSFDITRALSGPVNCGSISLADELAKICGIDLFMYVIMHSTSFTVSSDFISYFLPKYPIECAALASTCLNRENIKSIQKLPHIITHQFTAITQYTDFDDIIYNGDHHQLLRNILQKPMKEISEYDMSVLEIVSYAATKEEEAKVAIIFSTHSIMTDNLSNLEIVEKLVHNNEIKKAINFSKAINDDAIIIKLVEMCEKNVVGEVLDAFSSRYELFIPLCISKPCLIEFVLLISQGDKKEFLNNLKLLPFDLIQYYNKPSEFVKYFGQSITKALQIRKEYLAFIGDNELNQICQSYVDTNFVKALLHLLRLVKDKTQISNWWCNYIILKTKRRIKTIEDENSLIQYFYSIEPTLDLFSSFKLDVAEIKLMHDLIVQRLFGRIGPYDFSPDTLLFICHLTDQEDLAVTCGRMFGIGISQFYLQRAHLALILGIYPTAREYVEKSGEPVSSYVSYSSSLISTSFLEPLNFPPTFDSQASQRLMKCSIKEISTMKLPAQNIYSEIRNVYKNMKVSPQSPEAKNEVRFYMTCHMDSKHAIPLLTRQKQYDRVYQLLMSMRDDHEREECFIKDIFFIAASNEKELTKLVNFVLSQDQNLFITRDLWDALIADTKSNNMLHTLFHIYMFRNQLEEVASTSIALISTAHKVEEIICLLGHANAALTEVELCRQKKIALKPPYIASSATMDQILLQKQLVDLQLNFCIFCTSHNIAYSPKYDILHNEHGYAEIIIVLIEELEDEMITKVLETVPDMKASIMKDVYTVIATLSVKKLMKIVQHFKVKNDEFYESLVNGTMKSLSMSMHWSTIMSMIMMTKTSPREQCELFIEYDFLAEAYSHAVSFNLTDLFPIIAFRCAEIGSLQIYENCLRFL